MDPTVVEIPLRSRDGSVRAVTLVDAVDFDWLNEWRWSYCSEGYARRMTYVDGRPYQVKMHRQILGLERGDERQGDHINGERLDNRRENLRAVTARENGLNRRANANSSSPHRGVSWHPGRRKWVARVETNGEKHHLGAFEDELEAARVASEARIRLLGELAA